MEEIIEELETSEILSFDRSFSLARLCSSYLKSDEVNGRRLLINILNNWSKVPIASHEVWIDLIESSGFYPYLTYW